jgi:glycosyltransferase involved in cell wall biosynthesis
MEQTLDAIEIICVDDASPDDSAKVVERLAQKDGRIRLIRHDCNLGLGGARNTGIKAARAQYVTGIDSDDYILPEMMERLWEASDEATADVVACGMAVVKGDGSLLYNVNFPYQRYCNAKNEVDIFNVLTPSFCNKLWRKELFTKHDIMFPEHQYFEDLATSPRLLHFAKDISVIPDPLYCYVQREGSITASASLEHLLDHFRTFDILSCFLEKEALLDRYHVALIEMIGKSLAYHARSMMKLDDQRVSNAAYIRYLLMLKLAYISHNKKVSELDSQTLQDLLLTATSFVDLEIGQ